ncbi:MAG: serine hydroxymethyltransferase [Candidatus Verstraetearchaeota archaeon]|nr:serine hydroxymethyltransferase [Candidatus Verstraetearchaeota archaeon]
MNQRTAEEGRQFYEKILELMEEHHRFIASAIPLIASENVPSPAVREALTCDFGNRYAEGWPGERVYAGCKYIDQVELLAIELAKRVYNAEFADVRPISGVVANLAAYTVFASPRDVMMACSIPHGGHISHGKSKIGGTAGAVRGLEVVTYPFNIDDYEIDIDVTKKLVQDLARQGKPPKLFMLGASVFLFPHPVKEICEIAREVDGCVVYDAAHVAGLIAGGKFQDPLREGADAVTMSTHKTLAGPQHGMILSWNKYAEAIKRANFPGLLSNHHLHAVAGVAIALAEALAFYGEYAEQIIRNAKTLAQSLYERGFKVLYERRGFTESHTILVDISEFGDGSAIEKRLEECGIIVNRNLLPYDLKLGRNYMRPGGIRLGVQEVTRLGMKESEMKYIAELFKKALMDGLPAEKLRAEIAEFRAEYQKVHYCFSSLTDAYAYIRIR